MARLAWRTEVSCFRNRSGPKPPINGFLVRLQRVLGQAKAGMKKRLIILVRSVETLNQSQQCCPSRSASFALTSVHGGCDFDLRLAIRASPILPIRAKHRKSGSY